MKIGIAGHISTESIAQHLRQPTSDLPPGYYGAPFLGSLVSALLERGHTVHAFTTSPGLPLHPEGTVIAHGERLRIHYCPVRPHAFRPKGGKMGRAFDFFRMERQALSKAMRQERPDLVHAHWTYEFALAAMESGLPNVITCHDAPQVVLRHMPDRYRLVRYIMARRVLREARFLTAVSPYLQGALQQYANVPIEVIPNPLPRYQPLDSLDSRQIDPEKPKIAMVLNGWGKLKNPKLALMAFSKLRQKIPNAQLSLFGMDYGPGGKADRWIQSQGVTPGIHCIGRLPHEELLKQLSTHDLLLHPSLIESCPMGIAEAMMLGLPVVGGIDSGGVPWVIGDGGITTDIRSVLAVMTALERLIYNPVRYRQYSINAINRACALFSPNAVVDQYEHIYQTICQSRRRTIMINAHSM